MKQENNKGNGYGIGSLIAGIVGVVGFLLPYFAIIFSILAIVLGVIQNKQQQSGLATAGIILGIIGICTNAIMLFFVLIYMLAFGTMI